MRFWRGKDRNIGVLPEEIKDKVEKSNDFRKVKSSIWKAIADVFDGSDEFDDKDFQEMKKGRAPYARKSQQTGTEAYNRKTNLHHKKPRRLFVSQKAANDVSNLIAMSPLYHEEGNFLDEEIHYGEYHGKRRKAEKQRRDDKKRGQIK